MKLSVEHQEPDEPALEDMRSEMRRLRARVENLAADLAAATSTVPPPAEGNLPRLESQAHAHYNAAQVSSAYLIDGTWISLVLADGSRVLASVVERRPAR